MIITQTPLRISFFGGGTDFPNFYQYEEGCVLSSTIDKFIFVIVKQRFDHMIRLGYTRTELVEHVEDIQHDLIKSVLHITGIKSQIEIDTIGDIPATGTGLGSSSAVTVGVLNALFTYLNQPPEQEKLAQLACQIEIDRLGKPIGKQDQYIVAYGGLRFIHFIPDEFVQIETIDLSEDERRRLNQNLILFYTNTSRASASVLREQRQNIDQRMTELRELKLMAYQGKALLETGDFDEFGKLIHESWHFKKKLARNVSNETIDEIYSKARKAGSLGGKITGAGGGGFLLLYCPYEYQQQVRQALSPLQELHFNLEPDGSKVIFNYRR